MATPSNLYEYFKGQGQRLPSIEERRGLYGLGTDYIGTAEQNIALLKRLQTPETPITPITPPTPNIAPTPSPTTSTTPISTPTAPITTPTSESITGNAVLDALLTKVQSWETPTDIYTRLRAESGLPAKEEAITGIQTQVQKTEDLLTNLEKDINARISGQGIIEPMRRRMLATEGAPLREQYAQLVRGQGMAEAGLTSARRQLADLYAAQTKETPYQDVMKTIVTEQAKQAITPPAYTQVSPGETLYDQKTGKAIYTAPIDIKTSITEVGDRKLLVNTQTGAVIKDLGAAVGTEIEYKFSSDDIGRLLNVGFSQTDITSLMNDLKQHGAEAVKEQLRKTSTQQQISVLDQVLRGITPTQAKDETQRTMSDIEIRNYIRDFYKKAYTKNDLTISFQGDKDTTQADKDRALEILNEMIPDEMNEWLKKAQANPDEYKIKDDGIYEVRGAWFDKKVYSF